jgi:hypothetical protein
MILIFLLSVGGLRNRLRHQRPHLGFRDSMEAHCGSLSRGSRLDADKPRKRDPKSIPKHPKPCVLIWLQFVESDVTHIKIETHEVNDGDALAGCLA